MRVVTIVRSSVAAALVAYAVSLSAAPKVIVISLDGAAPHLVESFIRDGTIPRDRGLALLALEGAWAERNFTVNPSLTAPSHIAIATGSIAARNDIGANTFHLHASPFTANISGFGAPIGGYQITRHGPEESAHPTAEPLWLALRAANRKVVAATFPGADGVDVRVPGFANSPIIQSALKRTVDYTVPFGAFGAFGAFGGVGAQGYTLTGGEFTPAPTTTLNQLKAAGRVSFSPVLQTSAPSRHSRLAAPPSGSSLQPSIRPTTRRSTTTRSRSSTRHWAYSPARSHRRRPVPRTSRLPNARHSPSISKAAAHAQALRST